MYNKHKRNGNRSVQKNIKNCVNVNKRVSKCQDPSEYVSVKRRSVEIESEIAKKRKKKNITTDENIGQISKMCFEIEQISRRRNIYDNHINKTSTPIEQIAEQQIVRDDQINKMCIEIEQTPKQPIIGDDQINKVCIKNDQTRRQQIVDHIHINKICTAIEEIPKQQIVDESSESKRITTTKFENDEKEVSNNNCILKVLDTDQVADDENLIMGKNVSHTNLRIIQHRKYKKRYFVENNENQVESFTDKLQHINYAIKSKISTGNNIDQDFINVINDHNYYQMKVSNYHFPDSVEQGVQAVNIIDHSYCKTKIDIKEVLDIEHKFTEADGGELKLSANELNAHDLSKINNQFNVEKILNSPGNLHRKFNINNKSSKRMSPKKGKNMSKGLFD